MIPASELRDAIANDEPELGLSFALSDSVLRAKLNDATLGFERLDRVTPGGMRKWVALGVGHKIKDAADAAEHPLRDVCLAAWALLESGDHADLTDPDILAFLDSLVAGGVITEQEKQSFLLLGTVPCGYACARWGRDVTYADLVSARKEA